MEFIEEVRDILNVDRNYFICHAISGDLNMTTGLANVINNTYKLKDGLQLKYGNYLNVGESYIVGNIISLVVKDISTNSVAMDNISDALVDLQAQLESEGIRYITFPKICCGNMGMKWQSVKQVIKDIFRDSDVTILICHDNENDICHDVDDIIDIIKNSYESLPLNTQEALYQTVKEIIEDNKYIKPPTDYVCGGKCSSY